MDSKSRNGAYTRDGKSCNDCGAAVHYNRSEGLHFHETEWTPCPTALRIARFWEKHGA